MASYFTDEQVEVEIERLRGSDPVRLAKKARNIQERRRNLMWQLRSLEKKGLALMAQGFTCENIERRLCGEEGEEWLWCTPPEEE